MRHINQEEVPLSVFTRGLQAVYAALDKDDADRGESDSNSVSRPLAKRTRLTRCAIWPLVRSLELHLEQSSLATDFEQPTEIVDYGLATTLRYGASLTMGCWA